MRPGERPLRAWHRRVGAPHRETPVRIAEPDREAAAHVNAPFRPCRQQPIYRASSTACSSARSRRTRPTVRDCKPSSSPRWRTRSRAAGSTNEFAAVPPPTAATRPLRQVEEVEHVPYPPRSQRSQRWPLLLAFLASARWRGACWHTSSRATNRRPATVVTRIQRVRRRDVSRRSRSPPRSRPRRGAVAACTAFQAAWR